MRDKAECWEVRTEKYEGNKGRGGTGEGLRVLCSSLKDHLNP